MPPVNGVSRRILLITHGFPPEFRGGTELYVLKLAHALRAAGHGVVVVSGSMESSPQCSSERSEFEGITVWRIRRQGLFLDNWDKSFCPEVEEELAKIIAIERPDVAHVHHWIRLTRSLVATLCRLELPAVVTLHDLWATCARCFRVRDDTFCMRSMNAANCADCVPRDAWHSEREIADEIDLFHADFVQELRLASAVIVPSEAQRRLVSEMMALEPGRLQVVPHGTISDLTLTNSEARGDTLRLGHWGHLYPMKGFHLLLEALHLLSPPERARISVDCWGESFDVAYQARLDALAVGLSVRWHGKYVPTDLAGVKLDWAVLPSMAFESWSFVLDEAFSLGLPVIASRRGALATRVGEAGLLFEPEQAASLAEQLQRMLRDDALRDQCRANIPVLPRMEAHAQVLERLYEQAIAASVPEDTGSKLLEQRHRLHHSLVLAERLKEILFLRGRVQQEQVRADDLKLQMAKSDAALRGHEDIERNLEKSISTFEVELAQARSDYRLLLADHEEVCRAKDVVLAGFVASSADLQRELTVKAAVLADFVASTDDLQRELTVKIAALVSAQSAAAAGSTLFAGIEAERAAFEELLGRNAAKILQLEEAGAALLREAQEGARDNSTLRREAADNAQALAMLRRALADTDKDIRKNLAAANAARLELAKERSAHAARLLVLEEESLKTRAMKDAAMNILEQRIEALEEERGALLGRAAGLEATIGEAHRVGGDVALRLAEVARALGLPVGVDGSGIHALPGLTKALSSAVLEARNLMGEMQKSIEVLSTEAQRIETERATLEQGLRDEQGERERLRRSAVYRFAEKWAGVRKAAAIAAPRARDGLMILTVIHDFLPRHAAGSEIYTLNLLHGLQARGHSVHVLTTEAHQGVHSYNLRETAYEGIPITEISHQHTTRYFELTWRDRRMNRIFREVLEKLKPDVVHIQHLYHHSVDYPAICRELGIPVVFTLHEYMLLCPRGGQMLRADNERCMTPLPAKCADCIAHLSLEVIEEDSTTPRMAARIGKHLPAGMKQALKGYLGQGEAVVEPVMHGDAAHAGAIQQRLEAMVSMARDVDLFVSPSRFLRERFIAAGLVRSEQIITSDNGQDTAPFGRSSRHKARELRVGYIGTISDYKGLHVLTAAMEQLAERDDITCDIHGSLTSFPHYAEALREHSRNPRTRFHGRYASDTLPDILARLDVLVVPSVWWENSPLTIHEAFMAGLPVIASDIGGMAEFVLDGRNGLLFRVGDAADLAAKIERFADDRALADLLCNKDVPIKSIAEDAAETEARYLTLIAARRGGPV